MSVDLLSSASLLLTGLLAGEEFVVRYGVQPALSALPDRPHLQARQSLIARLRVLVPLLMVPTLALGALALAFGGSGPGLALRRASVLCLVAFALTSFLGTVPINIRVFDWNVDAPPPGWQRVIRQWATIDVFRSAFALLAFLFSVLAAR